MILASAAIPNLFRAVRVGDGTCVEIADRRNELAGNLSLHQELKFIEKVDQLLEESRLARTAGTGRSWSG